MKVWQLEKTGREHLHLIEQPQPKPGLDQVLIRTQAVSLNYRDKAILDGTYPVPITFPLVLASDLAGEVISVGDHVTRFKPETKLSPSSSSSGWMASQRRRPLLPILAGHFRVYWPSTCCSLKPAFSHIPCT
jgi:NADPH:quinone reductase-like Zn-dependent oxidoreductase